MKRRLLTALSVAGVVLCVPVATYADSIPTHGGVVHLDPFTGSPEPATAPPATGELIGAFSTGRTWTGRDGLASTAFWHHEIEIDVLNIAPGFYPVSVNGAPPRRMLFGPGHPDIKVDFHQRDQGGGFSVMLPGIGSTGTCLGGGRETGGVCKQNINQTPFPTVWGISVTEDFGPEPGFGRRGTRIKLDYDGTAFIVEQLDPVPEPATVVLVGSGLAGAFLRRRKRQQPAAN